MYGYLVKGRSCDSRTNRIAKICAKRNRNSQKKHIYVGVRESKKIMKSEHPRVYATAVSSSFQCVSICTTRAASIFTFSQSLSQMRFNTR